MKNSSLINGNYFKTDPNPETETYPFTGSSEIITDITSTGETLKANNLRVLKDGEILKSEACMMVSKSSLKNKELKKLARLLSKN